MSRVKYLFLFSFFTLLFASASPLQAQQMDSTLVARFQLAESYLRAGQFDRAISLLEDLYEASPATHVFYEKLKEGYENVKQYDEAIALVDQRIAVDANPVVLLSEKARLFFLKGEEQSAYDTWDEAIATAPTHVNSYRVVYQSLSRVRLFERAVSILEYGREKLNSKDHFQMDLAYLYSLTNAHDKAMQEYLSLLSNNERQLSFVRSRLGRFIDQEGVLDKGIPIVEAVVRDEPLNRSFRELLGWLYMENDQYDEAFNVYRAIDRLEQESGGVLFSFAKQAADAGAYEAASGAFSEILERYPEAPSAPEAQMGVAEMHEQRANELMERAYDKANNRIPAPNYEASYAAYQVFLQQYPTHPYYPEVLKRIGSIQQDVFFNLGDAESTLTEVRNEYASSNAANEADFNLGRISVMRGDLEKARLTFNRLEERLRLGELAEKARFQLALIHFYQGEFDAALTLSQVMNENTSTDIANDAIELKVLLFENKGPDSLNTALNVYAQAALSKRQRSFDIALTKLDSLLLQFGAHPLADDARFLKATTLRETGQTDAALAAFLEFPLIHPESFLVDRSLFTAAEIYELELGDEELAAKTYSQLLTDYPGSLLSTKARDRIRVIRGDGT
ncbi:MAG: tetratricopeptide repeat protein [Rhodothermales bacterium]